MTLIEIAPNVSQPDAGNPDSFWLQIGPNGSSLSRAILVDIQRGLHTDLMAAGQIYLICAQAGLNMETVTIDQIQTAISGKTIAVIA